jgi:di- and tripeptidase
LDDKVPCVTYGLRGVIHASVEISSERPDSHSGVAGGSIQEPMSDLINLLACLTEKGKITLKGFYDHVRGLTPSEAKFYDAISRKWYATSGIWLTVSGYEPSTLMARWRLPSLTIHKIVTTGSSQGSVIPHRALALISMRIVPDQKLEEIVAAFEQTMHSRFKDLNSTNKLNVVISQQADWWLGDPENRGFKTLKKAVAEEWGVDPLYIREVYPPPLHPS